MNAVAQAKERPVLFTGAMVRANLDNRKTQTRRAGKLQSAEYVDLGTDYSLHARKGWEILATYSPFPEKGSARWAICACPYGKPGDRLWVKETWGDVNLYGAPGLAYRADGDVRDLMLDSSFLDRNGAFNYDDPRFMAVSKGNGFQQWADDLLSGEVSECRWRPSIFMPRWASRLLLEIVEIRVERLQEITREDAIAEGCSFFEALGGYAIDEEGHHFHASDPRRVYENLWCDINGADSWAANPWVWVVTYKRLETARN